MNRWLATISGFFTLCVVKPMISLPHWLREAIQKKICFCLVFSKSPWPPPPVFLDTNEELFVWPEKIRKKILIISNLKQKRASKVFGLGSTPPPPWKMYKTKQKKGASNNLDLGWTLPPPFGQCLNRSRFFLGIASLRQMGMAMVQLCPKWSQMV